MLSFEAMTDHAKMRGMPATKSRGILREYLQVLILKEICRDPSGQKLFFTGGTYLRLAHELKRFSEDLDFNVSDMGTKEFEGLTKKVAVELKRTGLVCETVFEHWDGISSAKLIFPMVEEQYGIVSKYSRKAGLTIKMETNRPKWKIKTETSVISGYGDVVPCVCTDRTAFFADKIDAFINKDRGRHIYDVIFMLSRRFGIDRKVWRNFSELDPLDAISERLSGISGKELGSQAEALRPFLFDEGEAGLISGAHEVLPQLLEQYRKTMGGEGEFPLA